MDYQEDNDMPNKSQQSMTTESSDLQEAGCTNQILWKKHKSRLCEDTPKELSFADTVHYKRSKADPWR